MDFHFPVGGLEMTVTNFDPATHGFHFSNNHMKWEAIPFASGTVLCGGMAYAALDFWTYKLPIPPDTTAPPPGHPLNEYILNRQCTAHANTVPRFLLSWTPIISAAVIANETEYGVLKSCLRGGSPIPLCMVGGPFQGHHVVAFACTDGGPKSITIYDPNNPKQLGAITFPAPNQVKNSLSAKAFHAFFIDTGYRPNKPNVVTGQGNWRWCTKCQGLFFNGRTRGICPKGGVHEKGGVYHYTLQTQFGGDWKRCGFCEALYYNKGVSRCPAGGAHVAVDDQLYNLHRLAPGDLEKNWFECMKCQGMFWGGGSSLGVCPAGGGHRKGIDFTLSRTEFVMER